MAPLYRELAPSQEPQNAGPTVAVQFVLHSGVKGYRTNHIGSLPSKGLLRLYFCSLTDLY